MNKQKANFHFISSCIQINNKLILLKIAELHCIKEKKSNRRVRTRIGKGPCVKAKACLTAEIKENVMSADLLRVPTVGLTENSKTDQTRPFFFSLMHVFQRVLMWKKELLKW